MLDYCRTAQAFADREQFRVLFLDKRNQLIADEVQQVGTVDHTPVYPREVVKRALELSATAIILVHNHPSGDPTPSRADIQMTQQIIAVAQPARHFRARPHHRRQGRARELEGVKADIALGATCLGPLQPGTEGYDLVISVMPDVGASQPGNACLPAPELGDLLFVHAEVWLVRCDVAATAEHDA